MTEEKSKEQKIIEELQKTGFPTEIVAADVLSQNGYGVLHNPSYLDDVQKSSREFDLRAYRAWTVFQDSPTWGISIYLCVECKKSDKPWVFFMSPEDYHLLNFMGEPQEIHTDKRTLLAIGGMTGNSSVEKAAISLTGLELREHHHYYQKSHRARTYYEPMKGRDHNSVGQLIYTAVMSCTKAVLFSSSEKQLSRQVKFFYPIVIFSGDMYEAHIGPDKTLSLAKSDYVQLSHYYLSGTEKRSPLNPQRFIVDIVSESYLPQFLQTIEQEAEALRKVLLDKITSREESL